MEISNWIRENRWKILGMIIIISFFLGIYVSGVQSVNNLMIENRTLERRKQTVVYRNQELQFRITTLESPDRINKIAFEKLGMIKPTEVPKVLR